jgi:hypothetical protein
VNTQTRSNTQASCIEGLREIKARQEAATNPRSLTRQQIRDLEFNLRQEQDDAFEAMSETDMQAMTDAIDEIGATYTQAVDDAADEARHEACLELETIIEKYGYDVVKSYVRDCGNTDPDTELNLNDEIELL